MMMLQIWVKIFEVRKSLQIWGREYSHGRSRGFSQVNVDEMHTTNLLKLMKGKKLLQWFHCSSGVSFLDRQQIMTIVDSDTLQARVQYPKDHLINANFIGPYSFYLI